MMLEEENGWEGKGGQADRRLLLGLWLPAVCGLSWSDPERTRELWFLPFISCRQKSICWKAALRVPFKTVIDVDELAWERESSPVWAWLTCRWAVLGPHRKAL